MSGFQIELDKIHVSYDGDPYPVWRASVEADAYQDVYGQTPGGALHALEREFNDVWGHTTGGNWGYEDDLAEILGGGESL